MKHTVPLALDKRELDVLDELCKKHDMSRTALMRQALRLYQLVDTRQAAGHELMFSGYSEPPMKMVLIK